MANQLVSDEWVHPAERGTENTYTKESALEYLTPLMTKYAYERYRYNLTPREVYEILFEGCWESVDDFVQYMQNVPPAPEGVRLYTFEELDAMDAGEWTEDASEEVSEYDDENNDNYEDDFDVDFDAEFEEDIDVEVEEDVQMQEEVEEEESDDELMPFDPLPLYESQCADDETIIERGRAPSFIQPSTPPPEYRTQPLTPVTAEEVVLPEDSNDESDEEQLIPESLDDNKVSSLPSPTEEALTEDSEDESQDESDEELVSESQDDEEVILSSPTEDSEEAKLRADFKRRIERGWQLDMSVWYSGDLANMDPEKKIDSQEQLAVEESTSTEVVGGENSSTSSEDTQERAVTPEVQVKADKQKTKQDTVAWAATTARFPANVNASAPDWVDRRAADRIAAAQIAAAQIAADRVAEGSRRWADRFKKDTVPAEKLVEERSSEAESESSITQSPPRPAPASKKKVRAVFPPASDSKSTDTATVPSQSTIVDKVVKSRRLVTSTVVKVVPAALVLAGTVFWGMQ